ncbi:MAG: AI-2E family transporter [Bacteroidetes bacterium]|nr:AI-2E family transporter [Bacteroidota bacterium]
MEQKELRIITVFLGILVVITLGVVLHELQSVMLPFVIAVFLSYIFKPVVLYLRGKHFPGVVALLVVFIFILALFFGLGTIIYSSFESFIREFPKYQNRLSLLLRETTLVIDELAARYDIKPENFNLSDLVDVSAITSIVTSGAGSFFTLLGNLVIVILLMFFILAGSGDFLAKMRSAMTRKHSQRFVSMFETVDKRIRQYLITKTLISLVTGALTTVILLILGVDFALLWGFLTFLLNFIPNIGSITAVIFPVIISFLQFDGITTALLVIILLGVTQFVMGNVVEPKLMEFSLNLSPLLILAALFFWGWLWGIWGMILAVPMMSTLKIIFENVESLEPLAVFMSGVSGKRGGGEEGKG